MSYLCKMDYSKFFTYGGVTEGPYVWDLRADKFGQLFLITTKKNIFFDEGDIVVIDLHKSTANKGDGWISTTSKEKLIKFINYFDTEDFHKYCHNLWKEKTNLYELQ